MQSIDLFTGIGGLTVALHDLGINPMIYCEKEPAAQHVLRNLMQNGSLPSAPIHDDVQTLIPPPGADLVMGGFPCQGFSAAGIREGLRHAGSSLINSVYRIVDHAAPKVVFLENVSTILTRQHSADFHSILHKFHSMGYDGRYIRVRGHDIQCPQKRDRVYMLFHRRGTSLPALEVASSYRRFEWTHEPVPRMTQDKPNGKTKRYKLLGNSVIPELTRMAFLALWSGLVVPVPTLYTLQTIAFHPDGPSPSSTSSDAPSAGNGVAGIVRNGTIITADRPVMFPYTIPTFVLDPSLHTARPNNRARSEALTGPVETQGWATIRTQSGGANTVMTERGRHDLGTQLRFARDTSNPQRSGTPNLAFYEWLMGYPVGWTVM